MKKFWKSSIGLGDIASWNVLIFLKIVTKWREIQKSKLNNSPTDWVFEKIFSHLFLSRHVLSKLFICFAIPWNFNFAVNIVTSFSRQKPLKSKNKKHRIFWNTEFYHPAKFELKRIKKCKSSYYLAAFACVLAQRLSLLTWNATFQSFVALLYTRILKGMQQVWTMCHWLV